MGNIPKDQVICKCLDLLNLSDERDKTLATLAALLFF
ncbi:hypothetical protein SAMN04488542_105146 [Fontibacillus panacisegetis]|uniref:Uncharacterized protein n=1 Tax=Fontibacillus panacisegetis TaxID=670482 RepID=A0A1G7I3J9_9BACL|nr:hypothetical protein SAMN04488542_105146 [Fontibacillus panacisegetis]